MWTCALPPPPSPPSFPSPPFLQFAAANGEYVSSCGNGKSRSGRRPLPPFSLFPLHSCRRRSGVRVVMAEPCNVGSFPSLPPPPSLNNKLKYASIAKESRYLYFHNNPLLLLRSLFSFFLFFFLYFLPRPWVRLRRSPTSAEKSPTVHVASLPSLPFCFLLWSPITSTQGLPAVMTSTALFFSLSLSFLGRTLERPRDSEGKIDESTSVFPPLFFFFVLPPLASLASVPRLPTGCN